LPIERYIWIDWSYDVTARRHVVIIAIFTVFVVVVHVSSVDFVAVFYIVIARIFINVAGTN
jgi:hypothetical protein